MTLKSIEKDKYQWGENGTVFSGPNAKQNALAEAKLVEQNKNRDLGDVSSLMASLFAHLEIKNEEKIIEFEKSIAAGGMTIQTLIFSKDKFKTAAEAKKWAKDHDYKAGKVDETTDSWRIRQKPPGDFEEGSFRTIEFKDGIKAVVGKPKKE